MAPKKQAKKPAAKPTKKTAVKNKASVSPTGVKTTGHSWDGIEEYNNPLPRWWLWVWLISIVYALGYSVVYPSWPTINGFVKGTFGWTQYNQLEEELSLTEESKAVFNNQIAKLSVKQIHKNPDLLTFAIEAGRAEFALSCSQCHGAGGGGSKGFPNLLDDEWLYGGNLEDIQTTIKHGIRWAADENTRDMGPMMAFGKDEILTKAEIVDVVNYLKTIAYKNLPTNESTENGAEIFAYNCAACHDDGGKGNRELGAPPLNNPVWLYGGDTKSLIETIANGRAGEMPAFNKLGEDKIKKLTLYVHSLGGGE